MKTKELIISLFLLFLVSCQSSGRYPATDSEAPSSEAPIPTPTSVRTPTPAVSATPTVPPDILQYQCFQVDLDIPEGVALTGQLVINGTVGAFTYDLARRTLDPIPHNHWFPFVSPDGVWFTYVEMASGYPVRGEWLVVENADGVQARIALQQDWWYQAQPRWLDSQRIAYAMSDEQSDPAQGVVVINPFSGEVQKLPSTYPGLDLEIYSHFNLTSSYDRQFELVLYHRSSPNWGEVLWDIAAQEEVASYQFHSLTLPEWLPDNSGALFPGRLERDSAMEWFRIDRDGEVTQLTHFGTFFEDTDILDNAVISPDGQYVLFGMDTSPSDSDPASNRYSLTVLDLNTLEATSYCVGGGGIWSPDSRYIVTGQFYQEHLNRVVLLDPFDGWAAAILESELTMDTDGWWINP